MKGILALTVVRELVQELLEEEGAFVGVQEARASAVEQADGRIRCEVVIRAADVTVTAGVFAPPTASRRRLRIEMLKAMQRGLDQAKEDPT